MPFAPIEGGQIHYRLDGNERLPVLVLSNALGTNLSMWDAQIPAFTEHFRVLRYDSYGHGQSEAKIGQYKIDVLSTAVLTLIDHLKIETIVFCGLSVGGLVGQWLALNAETRLVKAVLCNTAARIGDVESWNARIEAVAAGGMSSISGAVLERWFTPSFRERQRATVDGIRQMLEATPPESYVATCAAIRDADFRNEISRIRVRTLVMSATHDRSTPPESGRYLTERILGSRSVELDAAHLSNVELPEEFSEAVLKFLVRSAK
jgi:3-oxoadipate enol-lactonase